MRAASVIRGLMLVMFLGSVAVAGSAMVWTHAETVLTQLASDTGLELSGEVVPAEYVQQGLDERLRNYRVRLQPGGVLPGRMNVIEPLTGLPTFARQMNIAFVQNGQVVHEVAAGSEGRFEVTGMAPGIYSVVGSGPDGYVAYGIEVLPAELQAGRFAKGDVQPVAFQEVGAVLEIDSLAVPPSDFPVVVEIAGSHLPASVIGDSPDPADPELQPGEALGEADYQDDVNGDHAVDLHRHDVRLQADGSLSGRLTRLDPLTGRPTRIRRLNVFLVQDNEIIAQAPVDPLGMFRLAGLAPGLYSFVAAGSEGLAAFSVRLVGNEVVREGLADELIVPVAFNQGGANFFSTLVPPRDCGIAWNRLNSAGGGGGGGGDGQGTPGAGTPGAPGTPPGTPVGEAPYGGGGGGGYPGGGGGFSGGGGGFGGGEGGFGALLGLAALGLAAFAASDDDSSNDRDRVISEFRNNFGR
jgi:hypothetical protein